MCWLWRSSREELIPERHDIPIFHPQIGDNFDTFDVSALDKFNPGAMDFGFSAFLNDVCDTGTRRGGGEEILCCVALYCIALRRDGLYCALARRFWESRRQHDTKRHANRLMGCTVKDET